MGVGRLDPGRLGLMAMPLKTCFYRDAVFLNQHTKKSKQKCMANYVLWEEE